MFNWLISPMHNTYHQNDNNKKPNDLQHWAWWRHKRTIFIRCIPFKNPSRLHLDFWRNLRRGDLGSNPGFHEVLFLFFPNLDKFGIIAKVSSSIFIVFLHVGMREWPGSLTSKINSFYHAKLFLPKSKQAREIRKLWIVSNFLGEMPQLLCNLSNEVGFPCESNTRPIYQAKMYLRICSSA